PGEQCTYADVYSWQPQIGRPFTFPLFASPGGKHLEPVGLHERGLSAGANVWPQVTPRPLTMQFTLADPYSLNTGAVFGELLRVGRAVRLAAYRDPAWRALAAADLESSPMKPRWETFEVSDSARFPELQGRRVSDLERDRELMPLERAVRKLTGEPADLFGFVRRGYLRAGNWADVCVFDPQTVAPGPTRRVRDFPADAERLTAEEPVGLRHVLVNGTPIRVDGAQLDVLADRPGTQPETA